MAAVRRWFMNGTPPSVFRPPLLLWNTPIAMAHKHFFKFSDFLWIGGRERIGDNRRHCSAILDDSPSVICFHPIERRYSSFLSCAVHTLCRRCPSMICFHPITQHILHTYQAARKLHPSIDTTCIFIFFIWWHEKRIFHCYMDFFGDHSYFTTQISEKYSAAM